MNDKYQITSDGTIFEIMSDGSINKLGKVTNDGKVESYKSSTSATSTTNSSDGSGAAVVFAWLFAIALAVVGIVCLNQNDKINRLESSNYELRNRIDNLESQNSSLNSDVANLRSQNSTLQSQNDNLKGNQPLQINDLKVGVTDYNNNIIVSYGNTIYSSQTKYLCPRISVYSYSSKNVKFYIKLYKNNTLSTGSSSPSGYSYTSEAYLSSGNNTIDLGGWGSNTSGNWSSGSYRFEIWYNGICLKAHSFTIY